MHSARSMQRRAFALALLVFLAATLTKAAHSQTQEFQHRWGGLVADSFILEESSVTKQWTCEDRRIRYRVGTGSTATWSYQTVPTAVEGVLRRIFFLPSSGTSGPFGWAVSSDGYVIFTDDGGANWVVLDHIQTSSPGVYHDLQDVHFLNSQDGWLVALRGMFYTTDGGQVWHEITSIPLPTDHYTPEYYAIDVILNSSGDRVAVLCSEPGVIWRAHGTTSTNWLLDVSWDLVCDVRGLCETVPPATAPAGSLLCRQYPTICEPSNDPLTQPHPVELWDIEFGKADPTFVASVGGATAQVGFVLVSDDEGLTWTLEQHECIQNPIACDGVSSYHCHPDYGPPPDDPCKVAVGLPTAAKRLCRMPTLYGLAILGDDTVIACGYNGQVVVRLAGAPGTVWQDRSAFTSPFLSTWEDGVVYPLFGVSASDGDGTTGFALITGTGGYIRESVSGGQAWANANAQGSSWRIRDVLFTDTLTGYLVGQHGRICSSGDGGEIWDHMTPLPVPGQSWLNAIAASPNGFRGVAVGEPRLVSPSSEIDEVPAILFNTNLSSSFWEDANTDRTPPDSRSLLDVTWASSMEVWAAGTDGLILKSVDAGENWTTRNFTTDDPDLHLFNMTGVAFNGTDSGVFVQDVLPPDCRRSQ